MSEEPIARPPDNETVADHDSDAGDATRLSTIGRYVVLDSVGMGGMGLVCAAYDPKLNRKVALKLLRNPSSEEANAKGRGRLFREAQALARLSHPNVVTVHDVDVFDRQVYIAMEFVEGMSLREWLRQDPVPPWSEILGKFIAAGRGLVAAHEAKIIHRDFKPANVLLSHDGDVRVADFGVAKDGENHSEPERPEYERHRRTGGQEAEDATAEDALIEEIQSHVSRELTVAGRMVGTPAYMAPEQHMGFRVGPHTDQYAFCVSLYEAFYGRLPYEGVDRRDQLAKMTEGKLRPPPKEGRGRGVPKRIHRILARGLRPQPTERWPSMAELLEALERDPAKRLRRAGVLGAGVLGLTAGVIGLIYGAGAGSGTENQDCEALAADIAVHWNSQLRGDLERAFENSDQAFAMDMARRVTSILEGWSSTWTAQRIEICDGTRRGTQSAGLLDLRMSCLDERAAEFDAMLDLLIEADDAIVERSVKLAYAISDPHSCASAGEGAEEAEEALDPNSVRAEAVAELTADLHRAIALAEAEKFDESLPLQVGIVARARALEHRRTLVRALYELARSQLETGDVEGGEASLREVIELSAELGDVNQELEAWARMTFMLGAERSRFQEAHAWVIAAESALIRAGRPPRGALLFESSAGALAFKEGHVELAAERYSEALRLSRAEYGESHPKTITMMTNYGVAVARLERYEEAEQLLREAIARSKEAYGSFHPILASRYYNLGQVYLHAKQPEKAEEMIRNSFELRERNGGPDSPGLANPLSVLAQLARDDGRHEEARVAFERVLQLRVRAKGERSHEVAAVLTDIALLHQSRGDYEAARERFAEVAEIYGVIYPDGHRHIAGLEKHRCRLFMAAGSWVEAVDACVRALALVEQLELSAERERELYELLAEAERGRGRNLAAERARERAQALQEKL